MRSAGMHRDLEHRLRCQSKTRKTGTSSKSELWASLFRAPESRPTPSTSLVGFVQHVDGIGPKSVVLAQCGYGMSSAGISCLFMLFVGPF